MDFWLTHEDGSFDEAAIAARAAELTGTTFQVQVVRTDNFSLFEQFEITADEALARARREAEVERDRRERDEWVKRQLAAAEADAQALAANYRFDVDALQFERNFYFYGNSTNRSIQLPRYERALAIALEREAARSKAA